MDLQESKTNAFCGMPFTSLCLVFRSFGSWHLGSVKISHKASSLYSLITRNRQSYTRTNAGRAQWMSSMQGAKLQRYCNQEGFNSGHPRAAGAKARIGMMGNNQNNCVTPDSIIGVGIKKRFGTCCSTHSPGISAGYWTSKPNTCCSRNEAFVSGKVFAYILAQ